MKKALSFVFAICMTLLLTVPAFADGRGPAFTRFDVVCTKETPYYRENWEKDGAWEKRGTFPAGTVLTVDYEYDRDGVLYGDVQVGNDDDAEWVYIRLSDVKLKDDKYLPENAQKLSRPYSVRVIEKGGIPMYAGPNKKYDKIATIPRGTKLTYTYGNDKDSYYRTWAYVTYLGRSGWIYVYPSDTKNGVAELPDADEKAEIWVLEDGVKLYDGFSFGNIEDNFRDSWDADALAEKHEEPDRVLTTLEKGKKYTYRYSHGEEYGYTWYYVTAGLRSGWVYASYSGSGVAVPMPYEEQKRYITFKPVKIKLYESPNTSTNAVTVNVDRNTVLDPEFEAFSDDDTFYYQTIQGKSGWYSSGNIDSVSAYRISDSEEWHGYWNKNKTDKAVPIYSDALSKGKTVGEIPAGSMFTPLYYGSYEVPVPDREYSDWVTIYYVRYNDVTGWVCESDLEAEIDMSEEETTEPEEEEEDYDEWEEETWDEEEWVEDEEDEWDEDSTIDFTPDSLLPQKQHSPLQIVLICVGAAVLLALTAVVTLLLIRRKRGAKTLPAGKAEDADDPEQETDETPESTEPENEPDEPADSK